MVVLTGGHGAGLRLGRAALAGEELEHKLMLDSAQIRVPHNSGLQWNQKIDQRLKFTLRQLEVFKRCARKWHDAGRVRRDPRPQSAASNALGELEAVLGAQLFDRWASKLVINENGRALLPRGRNPGAGGGDGSPVHRGPCGVAVAGRQLHDRRVPAPVLIAGGSRRTRAATCCWISPTRMTCSSRSPRSAPDIGFIEGTHSHPELSVSKWRSDEIVVVAAAGHPLVERRAGARQLNHATWVLREPGSGTQEASDRWLIPHLTQMEVEPELGSNEAVKRVVAAGLGLGCLSRLAVKEAIAEGGWWSWPTTAADAAQPLHRAAPGEEAGHAAEGFLRHCTTD